MPFLILLTSVILLASTVRPAQAATSSTLNFQGRLLTSSGALVPDGSYNIEFKIYDDSIAGSNLWTENRTGANTLDIRNGYFSAYLGSVTPFGASIPWDQELWMTMNVEGDGEMSPRFKLTAVPYAFRAGSLVNAAGEAKTADDFAQLSPTNLQALNSALAALRFNQAGSGGFIQFQKTGTDVFTVNNNGGATLGSNTQIGEIALQDGTGNKTTLRAGDSGVDLTFTFPTGAGTSGQCLKTNGTGVLSFGDCGTGGGGGTLTFDSFYAYDATGNTDISAGWTDITLDTEVKKDAPYTHAPDGATVTISEAGWYEIAYNASAYTSTGGNNDSSFAAKLLENTGGGFTDIPGSLAYDSVTTATNDGSVSATITRQFAVGDIVKLQAQRANGTITVLTRANAVGLTIRKFVQPTGGSATAFEQGGNDFGGTAILGTTVANGLQIITNNVEAANIASTGEVTFAKAVSITTGGLDIVSGGLDLSAGNITGVNTITATTVSATNVSGNGSGLTDLDGTSIATGTINSDRLSTNVALLDVNQTFTGTPTFDSGLVLGNSTSTTAGAVRFTGSDFEGFDGAQWKSLTSGGGGGGGGSASPANTTVTKPASESVILSSTLQNDDHLVFNIGANETWAYRFVVQANTSAAAGIKFAVTAPAGASCQVSYIDQQTASSEANVGCGTASTTLTGTGANEVYEIVGSVTAGATAGQIRLQWAQTTITASSTTVLLGSFVQASVDGGGMVFLQGGNDFGTTAILGTSSGSGDGLTLITDGTAAILIDGSQNTTVNGSLQLNTTLRLGTLATADPNAQAAFYTGSPTGKGLVIQGSSSQSANLFELQNQGGTVLAGFNNSGGLVLGQSTITSSATSARAVTLPDAGGVICLSGSSTCGFLAIATGSFTTDASTNNTIAINKTGASGNIIALQKNGGAVFTVANTGSLQIQSTATSALDIRNIGGSSYFNVDTSTGQIQIGSSVADANGILFVLDKKTGTDPAGTDGAQYYNSTLGKFRCFENGAWVDCVGTRQIKSYVDTVNNAVVTNNITSYWNTGVENNNSFPRITPSAAAKSIYGSVSVQVSSTTTQDRSVVTRVERGIGVTPTCGTGTVVGFYASTFTTNAGEIVTATTTFLDNPNTTLQVFYNVCSDSNTSSGNGVQIDRIRVTLEEANNTN